MNDDRGWEQTVAWALDFIYALEDRPLLIKLCIPFIFGKYAYREFIGVIESLEKAHHMNCDLGYCCQKLSYHKDKVRWIWWKH